MKYIKRIAVILLIAIISICAVFYSYYGIKNGAVVFAEDYTLMSDEELEAAYQAYLQSKGGSLLGSVGGRVTYMNGKLINFLENNPSVSVSTGIASVNDLKNAMYWRKKQFEGGDHLQLVASNGAFEFLGLYTQWLLQNKYFGDSAALDDETGLFNEGTDDSVYSGYEYNGCLVYITTTYASADWSNDFIALGTSYNGYDYNYLKNNVGFSATIKPFNNNMTVGTQDTNNNYYNILCNGTRKDFLYKSNYVYDFASLGYYKVNNSNTIYFGYVARAKFYSDNDTRSFITSFESKSNNNDLTSVNINFYTNNNLNITEYPDIEAEGNLYITPKVKINGEYKPYTINEGDNITNVVNNYYSDSGDKDKTIAEPTSTPDSGGGGNDPIGGTPPNWNNPWPNLSSDGEGGFNFNFTLPDLNIDWNINGLTEKFPFSIPFDFIAFCRVLNAEPQTPEWSGTLTLPMVNYPFTFSLQQFDNVAALLRNMEFIGFCIALILATRALIKG